MCNPTGSTCPCWDFLYFGLAINSLKAFWPYTDPGSFLTNSPGLMLGTDNTGALQIKMSLEMPRCLYLVTQNILCAWHPSLSMVL